MKNKLTRKLMLSAFTLLFAVISLGASTYAWFTLSRDAEVQAFEAEVTIGSGLQIQAVAKGEGVDDDAWQTASLTVNPELYNTVIFQAATPKDKLSTAQGFVDASASNAAVPAPTAQNPGYIQFDLCFKLTTPDVANNYDLYFDGYEFASDGVSDWTIDKPYEGLDYETAPEKYSLGAEIQYYVQDAARLAITPEESTSLPEVIYQAPEGSDEFTVGVPENNAALNYYNAVNTNQKLDPNNNKYEYDDVTSVGVTTSGQKVGTLTGEGIVRVTVTVWIEGWDAECLNAIFAQTLSTSLSFYLGEKVAIPQN